ncbi:MAG: DMT family transporter [Alphaproteobacteria bacterium]
MSLVFVSSIFFGFRATLTKIIFTYGIGPSLLILMCSATALCAFCVYFLIKNVSIKISYKTFFSCVSLGMMFSAQCYSITNALDYIPVSLATFIFFSFPVLIAMYVHLELWTLPSSKRIFAFSLAIMGLALIFMQAYSLGNNYFIGVILAGVGAVMKAGTTLMNRSVIKKFKRNNLIITFYKLLVTSVVFSIILYLDKGGDLKNVTGLGWFALSLNVFLFVGGVACYYSSVKYIGPVRVSFLSYFQLLVAIGSAVLILGETLTGQQLVGALLLVSSLFLMPKRSR